MGKERQWRPGDGVEQVDPSPGAAETRAATGHFTPQHRSDEPDPPSRAAPSDDGFDPGFEAWRSRNGPGRDDDYRRWRAATGQPFSEAFLRWAAEEEARRNADRPDQGPA